MNTNRKIAKEAVVVNRTIQVSDWKSFGKSQKNFLSATEELIDNAIHGILKSIYLGIPTSRVISVEIKDNKLFVKDTGCGMTLFDLINMLGYGVQLSDNVSFISYAGTGAITSTAHIDKENNKWKVRSRKNGEMHELVAPWEPTVHAYKLNEWDEGDFNTVWEIGISEYTTPELPLEVLGRTYGPMMKKNDIKIYVNGCRVNPVVPKCPCVFDTTNNPETIEYNGHKVQISFAQYHNTDETDCEGPYSRANAEQGLYYVYNGRLIEHKGLNILTSYTGKAMPEKHPELNGLFTIIYLDTFDNQDGCLAITSQKDAIDFTSPIGKKVIAYIRDKVSVFYREAYSKAEEADNRFDCEYYWSINSDSNVFVGARMYFREVYMCDAKEFKNLYARQSDVRRIDGMFVEVTEQNFEKINKIIRKHTTAQKKKNPNYVYKSGDLAAKSYKLSAEDFYGELRGVEFKNLAKGTNGDNVYQVVQYIDEIRTLHKQPKNKVSIFMIGGDTDISAKLALKTKKKDGYKIDYMLYSKYIREQQGANSEDENK